MNSKSLMLTTSLGTVALLGAKLGTKAQQEKLLNSSTPGSSMHIELNPNIADKNELRTHIIKENTKTSAKNFGACVLGGAITSFAVGNSKKVAEKFSEAKDAISHALGNISIKNAFSAGSTPKTLKTIIKENKVFQKLNGLPAPAKAGIAVAAALASIVLPITMIQNSAKAGYLEAQHEVDATPDCMIEE